jgi:hypothetical protein
MRSPPSGTPIANDAGVTETRAKQKFATALAFTLRLLLTKHLQYNV